MSREAFEAWIKADSTLPTDRNDHGYVDMTTALMWHAWQAARKQALKDAAQTAGPDDSYQDEWFRAKADAVRRILALPGA